MDTITTILFYVPLIFLILKADRIVAQCEPKRKEFNVEFPGLALNGKVLGSSTTEQIICQYSCHSHQNCDAYNYNSNEGRCEVLDARSSFFNVVKRPGWMFRALKCEAYQCKNGGTCFHAFGKDRCLCSCDWKGELCDVPNTGNVLFFSKGTANDYVMLQDPLLAHLSEVSVSMWVQAEITKDAHTPMSYASTSNIEALSFIIKKTVTKISINGNLIKFTEPNQQITDNSWHHLLFTWENVYGKLVLYIDGVKRGEKVNVKKGKIIDHNGGLVLGQEQDAYLGGFDSVQSLKGNLTSLNMWDRVLTASEISDLASKCPTQEGNLVKWSQLMSQPRSGSVKVVCSSFCTPL